MMNGLFLKGGKRTLMLVSLFMLAIAAFAVPAKPGLTRLLTLNDGTTVNAMLVGDEYAHYWLGDDGNAYRTVGDDVFQSFDPQAAKQRANERRSAANQRRMRRLAPKKVGDFGSSITGDKKGIIILVNFQNKAFTATQNDFNKLANQVNYNEGKYKGSMYDYFYAQSEGQFRLTFDVVGPYTVSKSYSYYGENDSQGDDKHPAEMVIEALQLANDDVNYADYDWDDDGTVDQVYVVYAGKGEADGGAATTIWPHEWQLSSAAYYGDGAGRQNLDGVWIDTYACGGEQDGSTGATAGIGTMCHEFSHCLGYPDFYDTDYSGGQGMGYWDLMDSGSYNGDGYRPAGYTSYERWVAGWKTPVELVDAKSIRNMAALQDNDSKAYIIYNKGNRNEYYLLENRQKTGWDADLPGAGLLILHVDYSESAWSGNTANDTPSHQRMTWVAADNNYQYTMYNGTKYFTTSGMANDPFPYGSVNAFSKNTTPAATFYNNNSDGTKYLDSSIENITQNSDGTISFNFCTEETIDFTAQGYANEAAVTSVSGSNCTVTFSNGSNKSNAPKYYTNGTAIRLYSGNTMTIASETRTIASITITFGSGGDSNEITTDVEAYDNGVWTGSAQSVTFTIGGTSGNRRIRKVTLKYSDSHDPAFAYYKNADGKTGAELKTAMCGIVYNRTEKSYDDLWMAFQTTDVRSDGKIWDMYSNITNYTPVTSGSSYSKEGDCYNREHSFPQSWFGNNTPMYTDLHHIYPTDGFVNGKRANYPFGETNGNEYKSANDFSKLGNCTYPGYTGVVFEPADEYKGDFARTYFYMVTCYEEKLADWYAANADGVRATIDGSKYPALTTWQLQMLMEWAKNDPVSEKETNRNNTVYAIQNNRNPFIDYPGLEEYVWGSMTTTAFSYDNYVQPKHDVTMAFAPTTATATIGEDFTEPTLTTTPAGLTVTYSSSSPSVATVDAETGEVTIKAEGTTTITATFAGNDSYNSGSASYTLTVCAASLRVAETLLYEGLSGYQGGNASKEMDNDYQYLDYTNWETLTKVFAGSSSNSYANGGCLKFGTGTANGSMTTGNIPLTGNGILTFYLKKYGSDGSYLKVSVTGATADKTQFIPTSEWTLCTVNLTNATGNVVITFETYTRRVYVDEIKLVSIGTLLLANDGNVNSTNINEAATNGGKYNVTLTDRTLYKDGEWNTLCLPFTVALEGSPLEGATAKTLTEATMTGTTVNLTFGEAVSTLQAGVPYIIKWDAAPENIENPVFNGVTIDGTDRSITKADGNVKFIGYYDAFDIDASDDDIYYMTTGSVLKHTGKARTLKACRAYFQLSEAAAAREFVLDFSDNTTTSITSVPVSKSDGSIYSINGVKFGKRPTREGLYIQNGRKVVVSLRR